MFCLDAGVLNLVYAFRKGDGRHFPHNPRSEEMLARLAKELVVVDSDLS